MTDAPQSMIDHALSQRMMTQDMLKRDPQLVLERIFSYHRSLAATAAQGAWLMREKQFGNTDPAVNEMLRYCEKQITDAYMNAFGVAPSWTVYLK